MLSSLLSQAVTSSSTSMASSIRLCIVFSLSAFTATSPTSFYKRCSSGSAAQRAPKAGRRRPSSAGATGTLSGGSTHTHDTRFSRNDKTFLPSAVPAREGSAQIVAKCFTTFSSDPFTTPCLAALGEPVWRRAAGWGRVFSCSPKFLHATLPLASIRASWLGRITVIFPTKSPAERVSSDNRHTAHMLASKREHNQTHGLASGVIICCLQQQTAVISARNPQIRYQRHRLWMVRSRGHALPEHTLYAS